MSEQSLSVPSTPLKGVSLDTFAIVAAIVFKDNDVDLTVGQAVKVAAELIAAVQQFDWAAHEKEMNLPKGEQ